MRSPTDADIRDLASRFHFDLTDEEVATYREIVEESLGVFDTVRSYDRRSPPVEYERTGGRRALADDDPLNAWISRCSIDGSATGPLTDWDVAIKDNVSVAGVEMTCGSRVVEGYVPEADATIVTRLLDAGARIVGKTNMDDMAYSGIGDTSVFGPTLNPVDSGHLAGGSSGGSAIAVATGEVDLAIGSDQGGSIRAPAAWSGVVGHKPTHGLVPYTGCIGIEHTIDHAGPLAPDVESAARALDVIAGADSRDPRQPVSVPIEAYVDALDGDVSDLSIGVLEEGFDRPGASAAVNERVRDALSTLASLGADVRDVSLPLHDDAHEIYTASIAAGTMAGLESEGLGRDWLGWYDETWAEAFGRARRARGESFPAGFKTTVLLGAYAAEHDPAAYARAMNLRGRLREAYDDCLGTHDLIAMPTTPGTAAAYDPDAGRAAADEIDSNLRNTCAHNMTGHPGISVPVDRAEGLPVGIMLVGRHFEDATVLRAGSALEAAR